MKLVDYLTPDRIILDLKSTGKWEVLRELSEFARQAGLVEDSDLLYEGLEAREKLISTGIGEGVAIPHTRYKGLDRIFLLIGRSAAGVDFDSLDGKAVHLFITIVGPEESDKDQLKILSRTARLLKHTDLRQRLFSTRTQSEVLDCFRREETSS